MKILYCCAEFPYPADSGIKVRIFNLARELARRHEVHLYCLDSFPVSEASVQAVKDTGINVILQTKPRLTRFAKSLVYLQRLIQGIPLPYILAWENTIFDSLASLEKEVTFDVAVAEHLFMARFILRLKCRKVLADQNIESELAGQIAKNVPHPLRWWKKIEAMWIGHYERKMVRSVQTVVAVSPQDCQQLQLMAAGVPVILVTNGVDCALYSDIYKTGRPAGLHLLFIGLMSYYPNEDAVLWFAREVLPMILPGYSDMEFMIVGAEPTASVRGLDNGSSIRVTGAVEDVKPFYRRSTLMVVPLSIGGGSRLKILEALAAGTPVVSTAKGAEGLAVEDGRHLLIAETPAKFAEAIISLHKDNALYEHLKKNGRKLVEEKYDWPVQAEILEKTLLRLTTVS
ncbi:MAG: glycosyltransferase [Actinomycetota bacterium]|jgi:sugar transferase (PEP-CTERM/EpsH1 system associated)|nr:glycosyltransferase family 4 protein [Actinomycetota bacterium]MCL6094103.1 glycosyltransferase family 4 protein [Actinomycetota bacterium]MDA8166990.1 glycosyltransferase [Actinomycetota bacterium]